MLFDGSQFFGNGDSGLDDIFDVLGNAIRVFVHDLPFCLSPNTLSQ